MKMRRFKNADRFRVISGSVCMYATAGNIRRGVGDFVVFNAAVQKALDALEYTRSGEGAADRAAVGIAGTWEGLPVQLDWARKD